MMSLRSLTFVTSMLTAITFTACATDSSPSLGDSQTPAMGRTNVEAWLADGTASYKTWKSETAVHASRDPSPHGFYRIYSNALIADNATGTGSWPKGAAAVKELYANATSTTPIGYAVYLKLDNNTAGGANWYWYERVPLDSTAPHDANGVVADGTGGTGPAKDICVGCHMGVGIDAMHTPTPGGRDEVYTPVH